MVISLMISIQKAQYDSLLHVGPAKHPHKFTEKRVNGGGNKTKLSIDCITFSLGYLHIASANHDMPEMKRPLIPN